MRRDRGHQRVEGQRARVVGHEQRAAGGRHVLDADGLHAEPLVVERAQQRHDHVLGQVAVEAEVVDRVAAREPALQELADLGHPCLELRRSRRGRQRGQLAAGGGLDGVHGLLGVPAVAVHPACGGRALGEGSDPRSARPPRRGTGSRTTSVLAQRDDPGLGHDVSSRTLVVGQRVGGVWCGVTSPWAGRARRRPPRPGPARASPDRSTGAARARPRSRRTPAPSSSVA